MKKYLIFMLVLVQVLLLCSCDLFNQPAETSQETESVTEIATASPEVTTVEPTTETAPATMGHAPELSDQDMPSADWSEGTNQ